MEPEKLEPEIYFEFVVKGGYVNLDTFRQKLSHFSTLYGDRTQLVTWTATLQNIGEIIKRFGMVELAGVQRKIQA